MKEPYELGQEARLYIQSELARYADRKGLRERLGRLPLDRGRIFAFIPYEPPADLLREYGPDVYRRSLKYYSPNHPGWSAYAGAAFEFIDAWLARRNDHFALFQADYFRFEVGVPRVADGERLLMCLDAEGRQVEAWIYVDASQSSIEDIELAIARGMSPYPPTLGMMTRVSASRPAGEPIWNAPIESWDDVLKDVEYLVVGAFDLDALLFWECGRDTCVEVT